MDVGAHQIAERLVHQAVAGQRGFAGKACGDDVQALMAAAAGAGVAGMLRGVIDQFDTFCIQRGEPGADERFDLGERQGAGAAHAGKTLRKGLTVTRA